MNDSPTPVTFTGNERIELDGCYVFRDGLAHRAKLSVASAVSYTAAPHLVYFDIAVPGSKKMTLGLGIPYEQATNISRHISEWDCYLLDYDDCKNQLSRSVSDGAIVDTIAHEWTEDELNQVSDFVPSTEIEAEVRKDLLKAANLSLESDDV